MIDEMKIWQTINDLQQHIGRDLKRMHCHANANQQRRHSTVKISSHNLSLSLSLSLLLLTMVVTMHFVATTLSTAPFEA
jgi:hypothetical protein